MPTQEDLPNNQEQQRQAIPPVEQLPVRQAGEATFDPSKPHQANQLLPVVDQIKHDFIDTDARESGVEYSDRELSFAYHKEDSSTQDRFNALYDTRIWMEGQTGTRVNAWDFHTEYLDAVDAETEVQKTMLTFWGSMPERHDTFSVLDELIRDRSEIAKKSTDLAHQKQMRDEVKDLYTIMDAVKDGGQYEDGKPVRDLDMEASPSNIPEIFYAENKSLDQKVKSETAEGYMPRTADDQRASIENNIRQLREQMSERTQLNRLIDKYMPNIYAVAQRQAKRESDTAETARADEAVTDARDAVDKALGESTKPLTHAERMKKIETYTNEELKKIFTDSNTITKVLEQGRIRIHELLQPVRERYTANPNDRDSKIIRRYETDLSDMDALSDFQRSWEDSVREGDKRDFSEFMEAEKQAEQADIDSGNPDSSRRDYFNKVNAAYRTGFGPKQYGIKTFAVRRARGAAIERVNT